MKNIWTFKTVGSSYCTLLVINMECVCDTIIKIPMGWQPFKNFSFTSFSVENSNSSLLLPFQKVKTCLKKGKKTCLTKTKLFFSTKLKNFTSDEWKKCLFSKMGFSWHIIRLLFTLKLHFNARSLFYYKLYFVTFLREKLTRRILWFCC